MNPAARLFAGGRTVFAGALVDRGLRFVLAWLLARALGPDGYGTLAIALASLGLASAVAPLGTDVAVVYLSAQTEGDRAAWRGMLRTSMVVATAGGLAVGSALAVFGWTQGGELGCSLLLAGAAVLPWSWLLVCVGVLRARGAFSAQTLSHQIVLPVLTLGLSALGLVSSRATPSAMMGATLVAGVVTAGVAMLQVRRIEGQAGPVTPADWRAILTVSLPQVLETTLFRMLGWTDVLLLGLLASRADVGTYKVAFSLAAVCQLPLGALATAYNPEIARGLARRDGVEVQALVGAALRGMALGVAPIAAVLVIFAGPLLALFGEPYRVGIEPLWVLVGAQIAAALAVPLLRLIPMSGRFGLNVAEHAAAVGLNAVLNVLLVPRLGALGAAVALAITWSTWALVGLVQARILFGIRLRSA